MNFLRRKQNGFCFPAQFFAGCIHFLEAPLMVMPDFMATQQQAGNEGKEGNPEPGSTHTQTAWSCCVTSITASRETLFGRCRHYLFKIFTPAGEFPHLSLTGSQGAGEITAGTTFMNWDTTAKCCGPRGRAGVFDHNPAISGGKQSWFDRGVRLESGQRGFVQ